MDKETINSLEKAVNIVGAIVGIGELISAIINHNIIMMIVLILAIATLVKITFFPPKKLPAN